MSKGNPPALARYFLDTELNEKVDTPFGVDFISIGLVNEGGGSYYGVNRDFNRAAARENAWVQEHVVGKLPATDDPAWQTVAEIRQNALAMFKPAKEVEIWARNGSYDFFILCRLFGGMNQLRQTLKQEKGIEKISFRDMNELHRRYTTEGVTPQPEDTHHIAVHDALQELRDFNAMMRQRMRLDPL